MNLIRRGASLGLASLMVAFLLITPTLATAASGPKHILSTYPDYIGGVVAGAGGVFFVDNSNGYLHHWDSAHGDTFAAYPPPEGAGGDYWGIAAKSFSGLGLRVVVMSSTLRGLYFCNGVTYNSATSCSGFIPLMPSICSLLPTGNCNPFGIAFDKAGNLWYADPTNDMECELNKDTGYTSFVGYPNYINCISEPVGAAPEGIFIDSNGNHWLADASCNGDVIENGATLFSIGESMQSIVLSNKNPIPSFHIYVGVTGICGSTPAYIKDLNDGTHLGVLSGPAQIPGIATNLYFTTNSFGSADLWKTSDKK